MASYSALPEPMLARSGPLPTRGDYAFEVKWDGFRAIVSTENGLRVRSRRGWDMTEHVEFLAKLPVRAVLDGELVALDGDGVRIQAGGRRRQASREPVRRNRARLDQDEEPRVLALRTGARVGSDCSARAPVRLTKSQPSRRKGSGWHSGTK